MDEIDFTLFDLCEYAIYFSSISGNARHKESLLGLLFWILFGYICIIALQALGISHSKPSSLQQIPNKVITITDYH